MRMDSKVHMPSESKTVSARLSGTGDFSQIPGLCTEYERLEKEQKEMLRGESRTGVVDPERFRQSANQLRKIHEDIREAVQTAMGRQFASLAATETLAYFAAWQSLRLFSQH